MSRQRYPMNSRSKPEAIQRIALEIGKKNSKINYYKSYT